MTRNCLLRLARYTALCSRGTCQRDCASVTCKTLSEPQALACGPNWQGLKSQEQAPIPSAASNGQAPG